MADNNNKNSGGSFPIKKVLIGGTEFEVKPNSADNADITSEQSFAALEKIVKESEEATEEQKEQSNGDELPN